MSIDLRAGMAPTADQLLALVPGYVMQGAEQGVASSTALEDTNIVVPIDGLSEVWLSVRWHSQGGGIRWAWSGSGTVNMISRDITSAGEASTGGVQDISSMRHRQVATIDEEQVTGHNTGATSYLIFERCICDGAGQVTFRFAQAVSDAGATEIHQNSLATVQALRSLV